jgi:Na+/pantothenate symporter
VFHLYPSLESSDAAIATLIFNHVPVVAKGLCLAAIMAAIMSTADTVLLIAGTTVSMDIVKGFKPQTTDRALLLIGRVTIIVVALIGVFLALAKIELFTIGVLSYGLLVTGLLIPIMAALYAKKTSSKSALGASIVGIVTFVLAVIIKFAGYHIHIDPALLAIALSAATHFIISRRL